MAEKGGSSSLAKQILNPDATEDGFITFTVNLTEGPAFQQIFALDGSGNNFFGIVVDGAGITSVTIDAASSAFADVAQVRIGGFADAPGVPDSGATMSLLGLSLLGLAGIRRKLLKNKV